MSNPAGYSDTPLPRKLGVLEGTRTLLDGPPAALALEPLPPGAVVHRRASGSEYDVIVAFCPGLATDLDENIARDHGLANGRVDVKVCAIDRTWSGLKSVVRVADRW